MPPHQDLQTTHGQVYLTVTNVNGQSTKGKNSKMQLKPCKKKVEGSVLCTLREVDLVASLVRHRSRYRWRTRRQQERQPRVPNRRMSCAGRAIKTLSLLTEPERLHTQVTLTLGLRVITDCSAETITSAAVSTASSTNRKNIRRDETVEFFLFK